MPGGGGLWNAVIEARRDEMRADEAERRGAADEEAPREQPEIAVLGRHAERIEGGGQRIDALLRRRRAARWPACRKA